MSSISMWRKANEAVLIIVLIILILSMKVQKIYRPKKGATRSRFGRNGRHYSYLTAPCQRTSEIIRHIFPETTESLCYSLATGSMGLSSIKFVHGWLRKIRV